MPGYPDWQAYPAWRGAAILNKEVTGNAGATVELASVPVTSYASLLIATDGVFSGGTLALWVSDDPTFGSYVAEKSWTVIPGTNLRALVPVVADYARIALASPAGAGADMTLVVKPVNVASGAVQYPVPTAYLAVRNQVLAASASESWVFPYIKPGPAWLYLHPSDSSGKVSLDVHLADDTGAIIASVVFFAAPTADQTVSLALPDQPVVVVAANNDAAASHTVSFSLVSGDTS